MPHFLRQGGVLTSQSPKPKAQSLEPKARHHATLCNTAADVRTKLVFHCLACAIVITWRIKYSGTKNVGIRLSGSTVIGSIVGPLVSISRAVVPNPTAVTRSSIPNTCHPMKLVRCRGVASFHATNPAVAPINMSPYPAGNANTAGNTRRLSSTTNSSPINLQICVNVITRGFNDMTNSRKRLDTPNQNANTTIGVTAANATANPTRCASLRNKCLADAVSANVNHATRIANVIFAYRDISFSFHFQNHVAQAARLCKAERST